MKARQSGNWKIGRNDPCWCRSGKKFKHCHLDRENQEPLPSWEAESQYKRAFSKKTCLAPAAWRRECSSQIAMAHTVPRRGSLKKIAHSGHVYSFVFSLKRIAQAQGILSPELIGINRASTFTGFCSNHDNAIFAPLEKQDFTATPEQCFLLGYRALAREVFTKNAAASLSGLRRDIDRGKNLSDQFAIQTLNYIHEIGLQAGVRDGAYHKEAYDQILVSRRFECVRAYIIEIEAPPPVMCCGGFFPEQDFEGTNLQEIDDLRRTPHLLCFSSFYGSKYGAIVFSWLRESEGICEAFIRSLEAVPNRDLTDALLRFFFASCENLHIQPEWWERLPTLSRDALVRRHACFADPTAAIPDCYLRDDGVRFDPWKVIGRHKMGFT